MELADCSLAERLHACVAAHAARGAGAHEGPMSMQELLQARMLKGGAAAGRAPAVCGRGGQVRACACTCVRAHASSVCRHLPAVCTQVVLDVASGLATLHASGVIHRDLKPQVGGSGWACTQGRALLLQLSTPGASAQRAVTHACRTCCS